LVDPREIVRFLKRGVEVHSVANLHAKVYVFGRRAIVGSANVSASSEQHLIEAGCLLSSPKLVGKCRDFVKSLRGEVVELEFARRLIPHWRPPKKFIVPLTAKRKTSRVARHAGIVAVALEEVEDYNEADQIAVDKARDSAERWLTDRRRFRMDDFVWDGSGLEAIQRGSRVLTCTARARGRIFVAPPARVLEVRRYKSRRGAERRVVILEARKFVREKPLTVVLKTLGSRAAPLRKLRSAKRLTDPVLVHEIGQLWPST
jgi:hypothetical protein